MEKETCVTAAQALREEAYIAFFDPPCLLKEDGGLKKPYELTPEQAAAIASHEVRERPDGTRVIKIRFHSKSDSLARLGETPRYL